MLGRTRDSVFKPCSCMRLVTIQRLEPAIRGLSCQFATGGSVTSRGVVAEADRHGQRTAFAWNNRLFRCILSNCHCFTDCHQLGSIEFQILPMGKPSGLDLLDSLSGLCWLSARVLLLALLTHRVGFRAVIGRGTSGFLRKSCQGVFETPCHPSGRSPRRAKSLLGP